MVIRIKYDFDWERNYFPEIMLKGSFKKRNVWIKIPETDEQARKRLTNIILKTLEEVLGRKVKIKGIDYNEIETATGKYNILDELGFNLASINYSCGAFKPDSYLNPIIKKDGAIELIVKRKAIGSSNKYKETRIKLYSTRKKNRIDYFIWESNMWKLFKDMNRHY